MHVSKKAVLIGGRRYVNTDDLSIQDVLDNIETVLNLPTQRVDTGRGPVGDEAPSEDWRYKFYHETEQAKSAQYAFRWLCGGNLCIDRQLHESVGGFDETSLHGEQRTRNTAIDFIDTGRGSYPLRGQKPFIKSHLVDQTRQTVSQGRRSHATNLSKSVLQCTGNLNQDESMKSLD